MMITLWPSQRMCNAQCAIPKQIENNMSCLTSITIGIKSIMHILHKCIGRSGPIFQELNSISIQKMQVIDREYKFKSQRGVRDRGKFGY